MLPVQGPITVVDTEHYRPFGNQREHRELIKAVAAVNSAGAQSLLGENCGLRFRVDAATRRPVIEVIDRNSDRVMFQIPPENVIRLAKQINGGIGNEAAFFAPSAGEETESS
jgi:uncharacterized FlaG/YvyC family protein